MAKRIVVVGSSNTDMTIKAAHLPARGETVLGGSFQMGPGGKGANQAVAAARLGGDVTFICKVGRDLFGDNAIRGYEADGIDTTHILRSEKPSGVALILVDDTGENVISVVGGNCKNTDFVFCQKRRNFRKYPDKRKIQNALYSARFPPVLACNCVVGYNFRAANQRVFRIGFADETKGTV